MDFANWKSYFDALRVHSFVGSYYVQECVQGQGIFPYDVHIFDLAVFVYNSYIQLDHLRRHLVYVQIYQALVCQLGSL